MEIKFTYLQFTLYLCVVRSLSAIRGVFEGENRGGKFRISACPLILSLTLFVNKALSPCKLRPWSIVCEWNICIERYLISSEKGVEYKNII